MLSLIHTAFLLLASGFNVIILEEIQARSADGEASSAPPLSQCRLLSNSRKDLGAGSSQDEYETSDSNEH